MEQKDKDILNEEWKYGSLAYSENILPSIYFKIKL